LGSRAGLDALEKVQLTCPSRESSQRFLVCLTPTFFATPTDCHRFRDDDNNNKDNELAISAAANEQRNADNKILIETRDYCSAKGSNEESAGSDFA
jgi:hypothetical protein